MQYKEFLDHIYQKYSGNVKLELDRMRNLLRDMGEPQAALRGFHIAGTNGKGSVCAALESLCLAHGFSTGLNTSPHLIDYTERFRIDGSELPFQRILEIFHAHEDQFERWDASFFEISTAIAFQAFREAGVHSAVIEVGLGGRLDATNLFQPDVAAITTIGLDHVKTLGGTVELIAAEKAGIIKEFTPVILGKIAASPRRIIAARANALQAPLLVYGEDFNSRVRARRITGLEFDYRFGRHVYSGLRSNLIGEHQAVNLSVALTAFLIYLKSRGLKPSPKAIRHALFNINWQGRMQVLSQSPAIIADGAHNVQGVQALLNTLVKVFPGRRFRFLFSILEDKNYAQMLRLICPFADKIYVAQNESDRAASVVQQTDVIKGCKVPFASANTVAEAFRLACAELNKDDILVCGGSLYTVGEVIGAFNSR